MPDAAPQELPQLESVQRLVQEARRRIGRIVYGADDGVTLLLVALATGGHLLVEGMPGVGKTTLAKTFARVTGLTFDRIQLTPDLMPADITGHMFYDQKTGNFEVRKGPVFTNVLLADELNRTPPRTQAALLEVMQEQQVTIEGRTFPVPDPFMVIATKNPIEVEGVFQLPEAELDRFMLQLTVRYPERAVEAAMLRGKLGTNGANPEPLPQLARTLRLVSRHIRVHPDVQAYLLDIVRATRDMPDLIHFGASPRAAEQLLKAARAHAALEGRWYVIPDDIQDLAHPALAHRLVLSADAEVRGMTAEDIIDRVLDEVPVPIGGREASQTRGATV